MLGNLIKIWHETLFYLNRKDLIKVTSDLNVHFEPIDKENILLVKNLRGKEYVQQFQEQLSYGDFGYFGFVQGVPVAYGWIKHERSKDFFFKVGKDCCYLCRFFTHESVRGHNIYPLLINALIDHEKDCNNFYIDIEKGNLASEKGLRKVGFKKVKEISFFRVFKKTLNLHKLEIKE